MREWYSEFRRSLKHPQVEEIMDLVFFRPLAFIVVKLVYPFPITPNELTITAILLGIGAGGCFAWGTPAAFLAGAVALGAANVIDCADGMLARLKGNGSKVGRIVDGLGDYIMNVAVYFGLGLGLGRGLVPSWDHPWILAVASGISAIVHAMSFDYYRNEYMAHALRKANSVKDEMREFSEELDRLRDTNGPRFDRILIRLYLWYSRLQLVNGNTVVPQYDAADYADANRLALRLWSFIGPTTYIAMLMAALLAGRVMFFFYYSIVFGNVWMLVLWLYQLKIQRAMNKDLAVEPRV